MVFVYLVGKTGTGKSSLLKTLYGEITLTEGTGNVVGYNLKKIMSSGIIYCKFAIGYDFT